MSEVQVVEQVDVLVPLELEDAQRLDKRIRLMAQTTRDNFEKVGRLLDEAKRGHVHEALGFKSWTSYVADALGGQLQLSGDARQAMVQVLAGEGMSVRAIAAATGVSKSTVDRDIAQVSHDGTPDDPTVTDAGVPQRDTSATVTGLDNKTYTKPKPKPRPKREPKPKPKPEPPTRKPQMITVFRDTLKETAPLITRLTELTADVRWEKTIARFNHKDRTDLDASIAALQNLRGAMGEQYNTTPTDTAPEEKTP